MLLSLLVAVFVVVHGSYAAPHGSGGIETIHYDQQQHATGNNVRLNMNKILVAILPLEDALSGLGLGGQFGGSSDYDDHFTDLTLDDLKPPPPPPASESEAEPEVEEAETSEATAEAVPSEESASGTEEPAKQAHGVRISNKANGVTCTRADVAAGRRCKRQRRPESKLASLLIPLLQRFQQQD